MFWLCFCTTPAVGAKLNLWEARPRGEAVRAPSRCHSPRVAAPTEKHASCTTQRHARAQICGRPALGAKLFGHRAGAIRRGSRLPQKSARPAQRSAMHGLNLLEPRRRGEAFRAPSRRHSPRGAPPTEERATCATQRHARAQFVGGGSPSGRSFSGSEPAPFAADRASHRRACDLRNAAPCTGSMCGRPALGAKLFGHRAGAIRRGSRFLRKCVRPAQRSAMHGLNFWEARRRGEALGHRAGAIRRGSRLLQKCVRAAQRSAIHGLNLWEARPRGEAVRAPSRRHSPRVAAPTDACELHSAAPYTGSICGRPALGAKLFGTEPAPFAAGRGSPRKSARPA